jgi:hypothetical protein
MPYTVTKKPVTGGKFRRKKENQRKMHRLLYVKDLLLNISVGLLSECRKCVTMHHIL